MKDVFCKLVKDFSSDEIKIGECWAEISKQYGARNRHYHTLKHLESLYAELSLVKNEIQDFPAVLFALFYHDVVYNAVKKDNEEKSAEFAESRMKNLNIPEKIILKTTAHILATKSHEISADPDTNLFTDADLSILGADWDSYEMYANQVRKEYRIFPNVLYNPGRKNVLLHFLSMPHIFKTEFFRVKLEGQARKNIEREILWYA